MPNLYHNYRPTPTGVKWGGAILYFNGYASHARKNILALDRRGIPVAIDPFGMDREFATKLAPEELDCWRRLMNQQIQRGVYICQALPALFDGTSVYAHARLNNPGFDAYVGVTTFETNRIPEIWVESCNQMDEIWVPSRFNRETFAAAGVIPDRLHVYPTAINTDELDPHRVAPMRIKKRRGFAFLSVFQWTKRKGWDVLLKAYLNAFSSREDVCLILRSYPYINQKPTIRERIDFFLQQQGRTLDDSPPILTIDEFVPEHLMPSLYAAADAFVLPTRGEGFGLPFMEAMAMELPVIATRWSGHLDFMNDDNSYLIDVQRMNPIDETQAKESSFYTPDHLWAEPSVDHTAQLMRQVYDNRDQSRVIGRKARQDVQQNWNMQRTANWMLHRIGWLMDK